MLLSCCCAAIGKRAWWTLLSRNRHPSGRLLLGHNTGIKLVADHHGGTALHYCAGTGNNDGLLLFIHIVDTKVAAQEKRITIHDGVEGVVESLLMHATDIKWSPRAGWTALLSDAMSRH